MRRLKITLSYDGTEFHGWQVQPGLPTVQAALEAVFSEIEGKPVDVAGSGRTDAGVHALAQVAAVTLENPIPEANLKKAVNRLLPASIRVLSVEPVPAGFHPRFDALAKTYEYRIFRGEVCPPFERLYVLHHPYPLDEDRMAEAALLFEGEHDFTAFAASDEKDQLGLSKVRRVYLSRVERAPERLIYRVRGSGFLKHMARNVVGALLEAGKGNLSIADLREWIGGQREGKAAPTVPARGLFLVSVEYGPVTTAAAPPSF
jgi:tRNA pseudouridine38-40 synthase